MASLVVMSVEIWWVCTISNGTTKRTAPNEMIMSRTCHEQDRDEHKQRHNEEDRDEHEQDHRQAEHAGGRGQ